MVGQLQFVIAVITDIPISSITTAGQHSKSTMFKLCVLIVLALASFAIAKPHVAFSSYVAAPATAAYVAAPSAYAAYTAPIAYSAPYSAAYINPYAAAYTTQYLLK